VALLLLLAPLVHPTASSGQTQFRTSTEAVRVDVLVTRDNALMLFAMAAIHEIAWHREHEDDVPSTAFAPNLQEAERLLRRGLERADRSQAPELALRLGRLLLLRGQYGEAIDVLRHIQDDASDSQYLVHLFLGDAFERQGRNELALSEYALATESVPEPTAARIATAHVLYQMGRRTEALQRIQQLPRSSDSDAVDPWLWYLKGTARHTSEYLATLRRVVTSTL
jgi:tetratricopeptide (TPR) repeat protein